MRIEGTRAQYYIVMQTPLQTQGELETHLWAGYSQARIRAGQQPSRVDRAASSWDRTVTLPTTKRLSYTYQ